MKGGGRKTGTSKRTKNCFHVVKIYFQNSYCSHDRFSLDAENVTSKMCFFLFRGI